MWSDDPRLAHRYGGTGRGPRVASAPVATLTTCPLPSTFRRWGLHHPYNLRGTPFRDLGAIPVRVPRS